MAVVRGVQTISIPFFTETWQPDSFYDKLAYNVKGGMHTLCLLGAWWATVCWVVCGAGEGAQALCFRCVIDVRGELTATVRKGPLGMCHYLQRWQ